jgi:hypothetical protein
MNRLFLLTILYTLENYLDRNEMEILLRKRRDSVISTMNWYIYLFPLFLEDRVRKFMLQFSSMPTGTVRH